MKISEYIKEQVTVAMLLVPWIILSLFGGVYVLKNYKIEEPSNSYVFCVLKCNNDAFCVELCKKLGENVLSYGAWGVVLLALFLFLFVTLCTYLAEIIPYFWTKFEESNEKPNK
jgi:hypothetical protein